MSSNVQRGGLDTILANGALSSIRRGNYGLRFDDLFDNTGLSSVTVTSEIWTRKINGEPHVIGSDYKRAVLPVAWAFNDGKTIALRMSITLTGDKPLGFFGSRDFEYKLPFVVLYTHDDVANNRNYIFGHIVDNEFTAELGNALAVKRTLELLDININNFVNRWIDNVLHYETPTRYPAPRAAESLNDDAYLERLHNWRARHESNYWINHPTIARQKARGEEDIAA